MNPIETQAISTYQTNLAYFEQHHPELHKKLAILEMAIAAGQYRERFSLEYKESYFDVLEMASGEYLYGEDSIAYSKNIEAMTDKRRSGGIFQGQKYVDFSPEMPDIIDQSELSFHNALWATIKIIEYTRHHTDRQNTSMTSVYKSIFIGSGLGLHIPPIIAKLKSKFAFIQENDLELFRLSLFVTDYASISKKARLFFSVMANEAEERKTFIEFMEEGNNYNLYLKHIPFIKNYEPKLQVLQTHVLSMEHIHYGYSAILLRAIDSPRYMAREFPFLNLSQRYENTVFSDKPVLFLFSGPSTGKHIDWIQKNQDRCIIITALSTCRLLHKYSIKPHVVFHIDPGAAETAALFEGIDTTDFFRNSLFIFSSNVDERTVKRLDSSKIYFIEQGTSYKNGFENLSAPSVGEYAYAVFLLLGIQELYLLGLDFALDPETLSTHSELHPFSETGKVSTDSPSLNYTTDIEYVKGNFLENVPTRSLYKLSSQEFNRFTGMLKRENQSIYNLGNGAYLEEARPTRISECDWSSKPVLTPQSTHREIKSFFDTISSAEFRDEDKATIAYQISEAKKLLFLITQHKRQKFTKVDDYLNSLAALGWNLSDMNFESKSYLSEVYYDYFKVVLSYIFDLFNTQDLTKPEMHIKPINTILVNQLEKMGNLFVQRLEDYLNP